MKIGLAISSLHGGGAEFVARRWITELITRGHEVYVYVYEPGAEAAMAAHPEHVPAGTHVRVFSSRSRLARVVDLPRWLHRQVIADDVDVMLSMLTFTNLAALAAWRLHPRPRAPLIISERNVPTSYLPLKGRGGRLQIALARRYYTRADGVIAISHPVAGDLVGGYGIEPDRISVVPNPVVDATSVYLSTTGEPRDLLTVGFVGRLVPQKRPQLFVEAMAALSATPGPARRVRGVMFGAGPMESELRALAAARGVDITFRGWVEDWSAELGPERVDTLLLPSSVEGFGNVCVEATRAGVPVVVCSGALGVADAVVPGITGELAPSAMPTELAAAVIRALELDVSGPHVERWLNRFSVPTSVGVLEGVLRDTAIAGASLNGLSLPPITAVDARALHAPHVEGDKHRLRRRRERDSAEAHRRGGDAVKRHVAND